MSMFSRSGSKQTSCCAELESKEKSFRPYIPLRRQAVLIQPINQPITLLGGGPNQAGAEAVVPSHWISVNKVNEFKELLLVLKKRVLLRDIGLELAWMLTLMLLVLILRLGPLVLPPFLLP
jgi:hypothetical protein